MAEEMKIIVTGDTTDINQKLSVTKKSLQDFEAQLVRFREKLSTATDPAAITRLNNAITATKDRIAAISSLSGFDKIKDGATSASSVISQLTGVVGEVAGSMGGFGEIAGEVFGAFVGGGVVAVGIAALKFGIKEIAESFKESQASAREFAVSIDSFGRAAAAAKAELKDFNDQAEFLSKLGKVNLSVNFEDKFTQTILGNQADIHDSQERTLLLQNQETEAYKRSNEAFSLYSGNVSKGGFAIANTFSALDKIPKDVLKVTEGGFTEKDIQLINTATGAYEDLVLVQKTLEKSRQDELLLSRQNASIRTEEARREEKERQKELDDLAKKATVESTILELRKQLAFLDAKGKNEDVNVAAPKVDAINSTIQKLFKDFSLDAGSKKVIDLFAEINTIQIDDFNDRLREETSKQIDIIKPVVIPLGVILTPENVNSAAIRKAVKADLAETTKDIKEATVDFGVIIGQAVGEGIGNAVNGKGNFFTGLLKAIGAGLKQLGVIFLAEAKLLVAIKAYLKTNPALAIAGGIALIALGTIAANAADKTPAFAGGVQNFGGGVALVGERGPELVELPRGSNVIPNHKLGGIGGAEFTILLEGRQILEGTNIVTVYDRTVKMNSRNG